MPNLVVYIPADVARALEVKGVSQDIQRRACKEVLVGLADGELGAGEPRVGVAPADGDGGVAVVTSQPSLSGRPSPAPSSDRSFQPDFKKGKR